MTLWGYVADPLIFVANKEVWDGWTPADRDIVRAAAIEAGRAEIALARKGMIAPDDAVVKEIEGLGVTVTRLGDADRKAFQDATRPVFDKWAQTIGTDLVKKAEAAVAASQKTN